MRNDWKDHFLSSVGRAGRVPFLLAGLVTVAVLWAYQTLVGHLGQVLTGWAFWPVWLFCATSVLAKRLHDRGRSGWLAGLILLAAWLATSHFWLLIRFPGCLVLAWALIELGLMPGQPEANEYGPAHPVPAHG